MIISNHIEKKLESGISKCPRCGKEVKNSKCDFCGYLQKEDKTLVQQNNSINNEKIFDKDEYCVLCPECRKQVFDYEKKCSNCGTLLDWNVEELNNNKMYSSYNREKLDKDEYCALCPDCGMQVFDNEKKCSNCGTLLDWDVEELKNKRSCFCCGEKIDKDDAVCPKCGANLTKLDISESRNPYTKKYLMNDGSVMEGNGWYIWGAVALVSGIMLFLYFVIFGADTFSIVTSLVIAGLGVLLTMIGSYRKHKGKTIVRKENDKIRETNPDFKTDEDTEDVWDKIKNLSKKGSNDKVVTNKIVHQPTMYEELRNLKSLLDDNIINQVEFDEAKIAILDKYKKDLNN